MNSDSDHSLAFGVGSFTFETFPAGEENSQTWAERVKELLESIPTIRDVQVSDFRRFEAPLSALEGVWTDDEILLTPHPVGGTLFFRITIPKRMQEEIVKDTIGETADLPETEEFVVTTCYDDFPVTFVSARGVTAEYPLPELMVVLVRNFLEGEVERYRRDRSIKFSAIGPSPFHASFFLQTKEREGRALPPFHYEREPRPGYDKYTFYYDRESVEIGAAASRLFVELASELGLFYSLIRHGSKRLDRTTRLQREASELVKLHSEQGIKARFRRVVRSGKLTRDLLVMLAIVEYDFKMDEASAKEAIRDFYRSSQLGAFRDYLEVEAQEMYKADLQSVRELTTLLEVRRTRELEFSVVIFASIAGGWVGAIIQGLFS